MTQEQKARAYDEAVERARRIKNGEDNWRYSDLTEIIPALEEVLPELAESEDERITRAINNMLPFIPDEAYANNGVTKEDVLNWLEKQKEQNLIMAKSPQLKEQKPAEVDESTKRLNDNWMKQHFDDYKERKPSQTEEERDYVKTLKGLVSDFVRDCGGGITDVGYYQRICDWLDGRHIEQKPAEWSEEDEQMRGTCIDLLEHFPRPCGEVIGPWKDCIAWLKSLRPQPHWKPSEEQMKALEEVRTIFHHHHLWDEINPILYDYEELMRDLQKLL